MTLVYTSVWIDHFRRADVDLSRRLRDGDVWCHPFVIGEVALGHLKRQGEVLDLLRALPVLPAREEDDVLDFVRRHGLAGTGLGWVDAHLVASAAASGARLLTHDRTLRRQAARLGIAA
jgi:hypothetical protein